MPPFAIFIFSLLVGYGFSPNSMVMAKKTTFHRIMRALGDSGNEGASVNEAPSTKSSNHVFPTLKDKAASVQKGDFVDKVLESFTENEWLRFGDRSMKGDIFSVARDELLENKDYADSLKKLWSDPKIFKYIFQNVPGMSAIKPLRVLADKFETETGFTAEDGAEAVKVFLDAFKQMFKVLESMTDPEVMATKMYNLATDTDPVWTAILARVEAGDQDASTDAQQYIFNKEIGDLVDLSELGFNGVIPESLIKAQNLVKELEPDMYSLWDADPVAKKYFEDPMSVMREAMEVTKFYEDYYSDKIQPGADFISGA